MCERVHYRPVCGQCDPVSPPFDDNGGGWRRADSARQHHRLADQSLHRVGVALVDGDSAQGQTEDRGGGTTREGRKERREGKRKEGRKEEEDEKEEEEEEEVGVKDKEGGR